MYVGKTLFAQVMEFMPWTSFPRKSAPMLGAHRDRGEPTDSTPPTPPGMRVRTGRLQWLRSSGR